jgi:hypothetical protein
MSVWTYRGDIRQELLVFVSRKARLLNFRALLLRLTSYRQQQPLPDLAYRPLPNHQLLHYDHQSIRTRSNG